MLEEKEVAKDGEVTPLGEVVVVVGIHLITTTSTTRLLDLLSPDHSSSTSIITSTTRLLDLLSPDHSSSTSIITSTTRLLDLLSPDHSSSTSIITSTTRLLDRRDLPPVPVLPPRARRCCRRCSAAPRRTGART
jgi:hypothetical protein